MPRVKLFNRDDVLHKAKDLFWQKGYHATSIQNIVDSLGISRSSLYETFGGKKQLFDESLKLYCSNNKEDVKQFLASQTEVKQAFRTLFEKAISESLDDHGAKGCFVVNSTTELADKDDDIKKELVRNNVDFEKIFYDFLLVGQQSGNIPEGKELKTISNLIYILFSGIKVVAKIETSREKLLNSVDCTLSLLD
jgi:TetR/AcrR family transcriptional repressor of nem operon